MTHILTFIAPAESHVPHAELIACIESHGSAIRKSSWLTEPFAIDIFLASAPNDTLRDALQSLCQSAHIDMIAQPKATRTKKLLISDMDSTIIEQECIDELADMLGLKEKVSAITARAMNGELDFAAALTERVALLKGLRDADMQRVLHERLTLMPGARTLIHTLRSHGITSILVSGGFTYFTSAIAARAGFDADEANVLEQENGVLTGRVVPPILDKESKREALHRHAARLGIALHETIAIGDGANDLPMILDAGLGIAYHAKPSVVATAPNAVHVNDLTALLYALGIPKSAWV